MKKIKKIYKKFISQIIQINPKLILSYFKYFRQKRAYETMVKEKTIAWPILGEDLPYTTVDPHYFYQAIWATKKSYIKIHKNMLTWVLKVYLLEY